MVNLASGGGQPNINQEKIKALRVSVPSAQEQRAIAAFLDRETARLDALIAKKERLLVLLSEKRAALISHAVTKGLDPSAPMRDSGVAWLGKIPAHWDCGHLARWWKVIDCKHRTVTFVSDGIAVASIGEVRGLEVDLSGAKRTSYDEYRQMIEGERDPIPGDIIYSRNATVGSAAMVTSNEPFCLGQDVSLIRSTEQHSRFLLFLLHSAAILGQLDSLLVGSTFKRINVSRIKEFFVPVPSLEEQMQIGSFCRQQNDRIERLHEKTITAIARLQEYRAALISAAVTGKIDVRGEAIHE
jgi:type I restriction enzyme, S subunit